MTLRESMHVESVYCSAGCVHKGEQFAVLVRTVANETRVASWRRLPNSTRVEAPLGLLFFCTGAAGFGSMVAVCAEGTSRVEFRWEYVR